MKRSVHSRGFSLIELLASIALLVIVTLLMTRIFSSASMAWRNGNKRIESNNNGRAAIDFVSRELAGLIVGTNYPNLHMDSDEDTYLGRASDRITFVTLNHLSEYRGSEKYRDVQQVQYRVIEQPGFTNRYCLMRYVVERVYSASFTSYEDPNWVDAMDNLSDSFGNIIAENIRSFEVFVTLTNGAIDADYSYTPAKGPPAAIDVYLEVLAEDDANKASLMPGNTSWIALQTRRYATRIYVENRAGYAFP